MRTVDLGGRGGWPPAYSNKLPARPSAAVFGSRRDCRSGVFDPVQLHHFKFGQAPVRRRFTMFPTSGHLALTLALLRANTPPFTGRDYGSLEAHDDFGIVDERAYYRQHTRPDVCFLYPHNTRLDPAEMLTPRKCLGHPAGDACLKAVAAAVKEGHTRAGELVARYGGEEFAVLIPGVRGEAALASAENVRLRIQDLRLPHPGSGVAPVVTVSIGVASASPYETGSPADLVAAADRALYRAKHDGRNRVCMSAEERADEAD